MAIFPRTAHAATMSGLPQKADLERMAVSCIQAPTPARRAIPRGMTDADTARVINAIQWALEQEDRAV